MTNNNSCTTTREAIELSLGVKDYDGKETAYVAQRIPITNLQQVLTHNNYSPIIWENQYRLQDNFRYATGFCADSDQGMTVDEAIAKLDTLRVNYGLITTRSHTRDAHRFRILLPFNRKIWSLSNYKKTAAKILAYFPSTDTRVLDGARQLFGSPETAEYRYCWSKSDYNVDGEETEVSGAWTDQLLVTLADGKTMVNAIDLKEKTPILCPFHEDSAASAFVGTNPTGEYFIYCSACGRTYWREKPVIPIDQACFSYYSFGTTVVDAGIVGEKFFLEEIGKEKFYLRTGAAGLEQQSYLRYLVQKKHIRHLNRVDHLGDAQAQESYYLFNEQEGVFEVHYKAIPEDTPDNDFIETYLANMFGQYKDFIKQWLSVYTYSNYRQLPTLVLKGPRGTGKNKFTEMVKGIYPTLSQPWDGKQKNFTPEAEKKLLVADESVSESESQYRTLKSLSGQDEIVVNKKFQAEYTVRNNLSIIILSNNHVPISVETDELPTSELNNQFFVYDMLPFMGPIDVHIVEKLKRRLGHYIRTELLTVYQQVSSRTDCRYSIPTPITEAERILFNMNRTDIDEETDQILDRILGSAGDEHRAFLDDGFLPKSIIATTNLPQRISRDKIYRNLMERGFCKMGLEVKKGKGKQQARCLVMTEAHKQEYIRQRAERLAA